MSFFLNAFTDFFPPQPLPTHLESLVCFFCKFALLREYRIIAIAGAIESRAETKTVKNTFHNADVLFFDSRASARNVLLYTLHIFFFFGDPRYPRINARTGEIGSKLISNPAIRVGESEYNRAPVNPSAPRMGGWVGAS